ncbi:hypothetical protein Scep_005380 [Stephania cephalantha]|uniref:DYW domain-containing protein n=1 Tax=Stephania cephalantha TaxID=152367 RepID=A0AAP0KUG2_9MAGN
MAFLKRIAEQERRTPNQLPLHHLPNSFKQHLLPLHAHLIKAGLLQTHFALGNFITQCATFGKMCHANKVFDEMPQPNSFVWNTMIRGYQQNHQPGNAVAFFDRMRARGVSPDHFTLPFVIRACAASNDLFKGQWAHGQSIKMRLEIDVFVGTSLIEFYGGFGEMGMVRKVFDEMPVRDTVSWTAVLSGYVNRLCCDMEAARRVFDEMPVKDGIAWNTMIAGYVRIGDIGVARSLFDEASGKDLLTYNTLLGGYAKYGGVEAMIQFFNEMLERDVVSWNTVIGGLVQNKRTNEAIALFHRMQREKVMPNSVTLVSILSACAQVGALDVGTWIHAFIDKNQIDLDTIVGTALVDMYSKCGALDCALSVFDSMASRDVVAWNAMIMGFSMNGQSKNALEFFDQMRDHYIKPDEVTMIGVLCACSHAGLVNEGWEIFHSMQQALDITPKIEHYGCMVDLLGRAGLLDEAYEFIQSMPITPHTGVWGALLNACKVHGNVDIAEYAIKHLIVLDIEDGGYLTTMSNIYANAGKWDNLAKMRELMREKGINKLPGCSSIEINGVIHEFGVQQKIHSRTKEIYEMIDEISKQLQRAGHIASKTEVFFDLEDEEKEKALFYHSEKLAIAFGLIATDKGMTIRVVNNLRVCIDCHSAIKIISKIFNRLIVVRDRSRFHHFKNGSCSCGDYW